MDAVETSTPAVDQPISTPPPVDPDTSLADHEAQFAPGAKRAPAPDVPAASEAEAVAEPSTDAERDAAGRFRQRAKSQQASPKDVEVIAEYTKRLRQAESDLGLKIEKQDGESDRAFSLRRQAEIAEALRDARRAPKPVEAPAAPRPSPVIAPTQAPIAPFAEVEPQETDFANSENPWKDYTKALAAYEFRRQIHEAQQQIMAQRTQQSRAEAEAAHEALKTKRHAEFAAFVANGHPDFDERLKAVEDIPVSDLLAKTIWEDDKAAELLYYFATHPDELAEMSLVTGHLEVNDQSVALLRRRIHARAIDAPAKATLASPPVPAPVIVAPRPPTRVQTGPLKTGDEPPGDDDMSLANHEKYFGKRR